MRSLQKQGNSNQQHASDQLKYDKIKPYWSTSQLMSCLSILQGCIHLEERLYSTLRRRDQDSDQWHPISQSQWKQKPASNWMTSLRWPLLSKLIFPLTLSVGERPWLDRALPERQLPSRLTEQTLHFQAYLCANIHTDRQANTCESKHNWKGER